MSHGASTAWSAIVPVKPLPAAKTRLSMPIDSGIATAELAVAFLCDVLAALADTPAVAQALVATSDPVVAGVAESCGAVVVDDSGHAGINAAGRWAASQASVAGPLVVLVADLPCLTPRALSHVLDAAVDHPVAFVADADGTGTTMWTSLTPLANESHFGPGSRAAHRVSGAVDLVARVPADAAGPWLPARLDVDTVADLARARSLGLGPASAALLSAADPVIPVTVLRTSDDQVVAADEDGRVRRLPLAWVHAAGWRAVVPGQRLFVSRDRVEPGA